MDLTVYPSEEQDNDSTRAALPRWAVVALAAVVIHGVPLSMLTFANKTTVEEDEPIPVEIAEIPPELLAPALMPVPPPPAAKPALTPPPAAAKPVPEAPKPVEKPPEAPKAATPPPEAKPAPATPAAPPPEPKRARHEVDVNKSTPSAFDESKPSETAPKFGFTSDRNGKAADRGPKDLPKGDPFMTGESNRVLYGKDKRGEGNLPPVSSDATAGSIKLEGTPEPGDDRREPLQKIDVTAPKQAIFEEPTPRPAEKKAEPKALPAPEKTEGVRPRNVEAAKPALAPTPAKVAAPELETAPPLNKDDGERSVKPKPVEKDQALKTPSIDEVVAPRNEDAASPKVNLTPPPRPEPEPQRPVQRELTPDEQADIALAALANRRRATSDQGKVGARERRGEVGLQGNGVPNPGHQTAASDITTINRNSSAEDFGDESFNKIRDPKAAYKKDLIRYTVGIWKADIQAQQRLFIERGSVEMRIIMRKDGHLVGATEVRHWPPELPPRYITTCKTAIESAATPKYHPFPQELDHLDTIEFFFTFGY